MRYKKNLISGALLIIFGIILNIVYFTGNGDMYWSGMGFGFLFAGAIQLYKNIKYKTNSEYRERVDIEINDERNKYLSNKAWAWTGYLSVISIAIFSIIIKIAGYDDLSAYLSYGVCFILIIYVLSYIYLRRKY